MDWNKAKKIIIIILVFLNLGLFGINYIIKRSYKLSANGEKAIYEVLAKNNIALYSNLPTSYPPMAQITLAPTEIKYEKILPIFFKSTDILYKSLEFTETYYSEGKKSLKIGDNYISYTNKEIKDTYKNSDYNNAIMVAERYSREISEAIGYKGGINLISYSKEDYGYLFTYVEEYKGIKLFCNSIAIGVADNEVISLKASKYEIGYFEDTKKEIASPDEMMLTLIYELNKENSAKNRTINAIELGYDLQSSSEIAQGDSIKLIPYYRVYFQNSKTPLIINAYTNEVLNLSSLG